MKRILILLAFALLLFNFSCTKDKDGFGQKTRYGSFSVELIGLPGWATLDVYVGTKRIDTLAPGHPIGIPAAVALEAGAPSTLSFKKKGADSLVIDTTITLSVNEKAALKIAYSPKLGIKSFTSGNTNVSADSTSFFVFSQLPVVMTPDEVIIDAYLFKLNQDGSYSETAIVWSHLERNKLHPKMVTVRSTANPDGTTNTYVIKLKNVSTGEFIKDGFGRDYIAPYFEAGAREIITLAAVQLFGLNLFQSQYATY